MNPRHSGTTAARLGAIEAGGTKFVCAIGTTSGELIRTERIPATTPVETLERVFAFFAARDDKLAAMGIGTFGPVQLDPSSPHFGFITSTPKTSWRYFDLAGTVRRGFEIPIAFDTDVNAAALAEATWGGARGLRTFLYITVGTGIGGGAMIEGSLLHGLVHPEMGHIRVPHDRRQDPFPGICPYHGDCLEGLASGPAMGARWGTSPETLAPEHPAWIFEAEYLALACVNWICALSPQRILFGGGVMQPHLFPLVRERVIALLNGYVDAPELTQRIDVYIAPSPLGGRAGVLGALALAAREALKLRSVCP